MKTKICKILNIMVLIYIFNFPTVLADEQNMLDQNLELDLIDETIVEVLPSSDLVDVTDDSSEVNVSNQEQYSDFEAEKDFVDYDFSDEYSDPSFLPIQDEEVTTDQVEPDLYLEPSELFNSQSPVDNILQHEDQSEPAQATETPEDESESIQATETPEDESESIQATETPEDESESIQATETPEDESESIQATEAQETQIEPTQALEAQETQIEPTQAPEAQETQIEPTQALEAQETQIEPTQATEEHEEQLEVTQATEVPGIQAQEQEQEQEIDNSQADANQELLDFSVQNDNSFRGISEDEPISDNSDLLIQDESFEIHVRSEDSVEKQESKHEQEMYTIDYPLLEGENSELGTQSDSRLKSTTQAIESSGFETFFIEAKDIKNSNLNEINIPKDYSLFEKKHSLNNLSLGSFEFQKKERIDILKNYESSLKSLDIDGSRDQGADGSKSKALFYNSKLRSLSIVAFASHDIQMSSPKKTALSSTDQAREDLQRKHDSLGFLDKVHPSKVSQDLNADGCADLIENNLEFRKFCNFLDHNTVNQTDRLSLNLDSIKNVFNTQKVVLNGVAKANSKVELHLVSVDSDKILSVLESDKNGNFIYLLDSSLVPSKARFYLKDEFSNVSKDYSYAFDYSKQKQSPKILKLCGQNYESGNVVLCNPKEGFDIKLKSEYQTLTKAYFNSVIHTAMVATNNTQDIAVVNPDSNIKSDLKSGEVHRVILQNFDPLNPSVLSEPVEIFYKVHYPIINPVLLPLFVLLFLLAVVILYDYLIYSYQELNSKLIYESYQVFKNSDISHSSN
jgi:hypothetical protein